MVDEARTALADVLVSELAKLRRLSAGPDLLGEAERKCMETYARIVKLLERSPAAESAPKTWSSEEINRVLEGRGTSVPLVPEAPGRLEPQPGGKGRWDDEADSSFSGL